jgi:hypothetical protein
MTADVLAFQFKVAPADLLAGTRKVDLGSRESAFAESPNRVFILERGELPAMKRFEEVPYPKVGPSISFPVSPSVFTVPIRS